jgi:hypothetical protein
MIATTATTEQPMPTPRKDIRLLLCMTRLPSAADGTAVGSVIRASGSGNGGDDAVGSCAPQKRHFIAAASIVSAQNGHRLVGPKAAFRPPVLLEITHATVPTINVAIIPSASFPNTLNKESAINAAQPVPKNHTSLPAADPSWIIAAVKDRANRSSMSSNASMLKS